VGCNDARWIFFCGEKINYHLSNEFFL
jgi:hypothetical protein